MHLAYVQPIFRMNIWKTNWFRCTRNTQIQFVLIEKDLRFEYRKWTIITILHIVTYDSLASRLSVSRSSDSRSGNRSVFFERSQFSRSLVSRSFVWRLFMYRSFILNREFKIVTTKPLIKNEVVNLLLLYIFVDLIDKN